jgi:rhamnosyltransferase
MRTCAVIVSYNPTAVLEKAVSQLLNQAERIIVVDNASSVQACNEILDSVEQVSPKIQVIRNNENVGVAEALNIGIRLVIDCDFDWILTLDQDSVINENYLKHMYDFAARNSNKRIGILGPTYEFKDKGRKKIQLPHKLLVTLTSGSLVNTEVFRNVGLFRSDYFIDYVDFEFCLRLAKFNYSLFRIPEAVLYHEMGEVKTRRLPFKVKYTTYDTQRRFYKSRNRVLTYRMYFKLFPLWVLADLMRFLKEIIKILLTEENSMDHLRAEVAGVKEALKTVDPLRQQPPEG